MAAVTGADPEEFMPQEDEDDPEMIEANHKALESALMIFAGQN